MLGFAHSVAFVKYGKILVMANFESFCNVSPVGRFENQAAWAFMDQLPFQQFRRGALNQKV
jgi:hypothetical protein